MEIYYWTDTPLIKSKTKTPTVLPIKDYQRHAIWDWYFIYRLGYAKVDKKYHASFGAGNCLTVFPRVLLPLKWVGVGRRRKWFRYFPWVLFMFSCICGYIRVLYLYVYVHTHTQYWAEGLQLLAQSLQEPEHTNTRVTRILAHIPCLSFCFFIWSQLC